MKMLANISLFDGLMSGGACSYPAVFNEAVEVWASPYIGYNVIKTDNGKFEVHSSIQGQKDVVLGTYANAQEAIAAAKKCYQ